VPGSWNGKRAGIKKHSYGLKKTVEQIAGRGKATSRLSQRYPIPYVAVHFNRPKNYLTAPHIL
jgi:hypothetical protein